MQNSIPKKQVLNCPITALHFEEQIFLLLKWAKTRESRIVCLANVHMLMEAYWHKKFATVLKSADIVTPDGMPLVWMLRQMRMYSQDRVAGMDVFLRLCELSSQSNVSVFFVGSQREVLERMRERLEKEFPNLLIAGMKPLPFKPLNHVEDQNLIEEINISGAGLVFVCLGCPKQEYWMVEHKNKIHSVMLGVGAVFALYAGLQKRAPHSIRESGLEWLYRLIQEPRRLWKRYSQTIPPFIWLALQQLQRQKKSQSLRELGQSFNSILNDQHFFGAKFDWQIDNFKASKIGEILVRQNLVSQTCLSVALEKQRINHKKPKIGEILVNQGDICQAELEYHLKNQRIKLGELLVNNKIISQVQLDRWLKTQKFTFKKLGEIIVEQKILSHEDLKQCLLEQYLRRRGIWLTDIESFRKLEGM